MDIAGKIIDFIFMIDFTFNFFTAFYDKERLITNKKAILWRYMRGTLIIDFITAIPINIFLPTVKDDSTFFFPWKETATRYPRVLRLIRLTKLLRFYRVVSDRDTFVEIIVFRRAMSRTTKKLIETAVVVVLLFHTLACLWYIIGSKDFLVC